MKLRIIAFVIALLALAGEAEAQTCYRLPGGRYTCSSAPQSQQCNYNYGRC